VLIALAAVFVAPQVPHGYAVAGGALLCVAVALFFIYTAVRLFFFLPAVVVAENRIGLGRSWSLGGGNFWRVVFVWLLIFLPVGFIAGVALQMTVLPVVVMEAMKLKHEPGLKDILAFLHGLIPLLPVVITILLLQGIAVRGLLMGAIGSAYNAVTAKPADADAPVQPAAPAEGATSA
jgi:hypothetical protein